MRWRRSVPTSLGLVACLALAEAFAAEEEKVEGEKVAQAAPVEGAASPAPPAEVTATDAPTSTERISPISVSAYVDAYYSQRTGPGDARAPSAGRVFDVSNGTFMLAYAELVMQMPAEPIGFRIDVGFGEVAELTSYDAADPTAPGVSAVFKHIQQVYGSVTLPGPLP
jgi:hypothetical protein